MRPLNLLPHAIAISSLVLLNACQIAGPQSIAIGRERYNTILQSTAMEQTMSNIVRVYQHEPPMFMDVSQVNAALSFTNSIAPNLSNLGDTYRVAPGSVGTLGGTLQYTETPTITYTPLSGQALVAQLVTPVSVDALGLLYDSYWNVGPLLDFSTAYLTPVYREFYPALNTIIELNNNAALELVAAKSAATTNGQAAPAPPSGGSSPSSKPAASNNDALVIYLRPFHRTVGRADARVLQLWVRLLRIYGAQPSFVLPAKGCSDFGSNGVLDQALLRDWDVNLSKHIDPKNAKGGTTLDTALANARGCLPSAIELRILPLSSGGSALSGPSSPGGFIAPVMRTYSALGILKNATEHPTPKIEFVSPDRYREIRSHRWNNDVDGASYYTLLSGDLDSVDCPPGRMKAGCDNPLTQDHRSAVADKIDRWIEAAPDPTAEPDPSTLAAYPSGLDVYEAPDADFLDAESIAMNAWLGTLRRYVLVVVSAERPTEPVYTSHYDGGRWYYIAKDDVVSEKNFQLLSLFGTMMAVPPSTQPLTPVINVGG